MIARRKTRQIHIGNVAVGGDAPISVQSMATASTKDAAATIDQIQRLTEAGCEIIRVAVPDEADAKAIAKIKQGISIPLIADIHFDHRLALIAVDSGVDGLRINPGNIGRRERVEQVVKACQANRVPIRIGVNSGSIEKALVKKYGGPTPEAMVQSALEHIKILEQLDFHDVKVSLKASDIPRTVAANRLFAQKTDIPLHLGVTEAGTHYAGTVKSAIGLGILLAEGIGDTIRVSLTGDPEPEIRAGFEILKSLELRRRGIHFVSCPNCARMEGPILEMIEALEKELADIDHPFHLAVMGCSVNGPGESREADVGVIAAPNDHFLIYRDKKFWKKVPHADVVPLVSEVIRQMSEKENRS
jgi:(E)-4-hydroxy-3-methylbut-2-enyl-diphosphate synthase